MKRLLAYLTPANIALSLIWSLVSWSIQMYLGIPLWWSLVANLFFGAAFCIKYPATGSLRNLRFSDDWMLIGIGTLVSFCMLQWLKKILSIPTWGYYLALIFSIIILERVLIEIKKMVMR